MVAADDVKPDPITNVGMIVNFSERVVTFNGYRVPIEQADTTMVQFQRQQTVTVSGTKLKPFTVASAVDRITGAANVTFMYEQVGNNATWDLMPTCDAAVLECAPHW